MLVCECVLLLATTLALAILWRPGCPVVANTWVTYAYTSAFSGPSSSSGPRYCPWLTSHHLIYLVKISGLLIGHSVPVARWVDASHGGWWAWIGAGSQRRVSVCAYVTVAIFMSVFDMNIFCDIMQLVEQLHYVSKYNPLVNTLHYHLTHNIPLKPCTTVNRWILLEIWLYINNKMLWFYWEIGIDTLTEIISTPITFFNFEESE